MNSLKAFLSPCTIMNAESEFQAGTLNVLMQNGQLVRMFDRDGHPQSFVVAPIDDPESLGEAGVTAFSLIAEQPDWIVVLDRENQVRGVIEPNRTRELRIAANATITRGEFSSKMTLPPGEVKVTVNFYGCAKHPEVARFALHQVGQLIPSCPTCGEPMKKLQEKSSRSKARRS
jgi:hypothetical protein